MRVLVDGVDIGERMRAKFACVTADLTAGYAASGASFDVIGEYDYEKTDFAPAGAARVLQLGAKVEVQLGYIRTETVFVGLIAQVCYEFEEDDAPCIHVECMDAKCLLMKIQRLEIRSEKKLAAVAAPCWAASRSAAISRGGRSSSPKPRPSRCRCTWRAITTSLCARRSTRDVSFSSAQARRISASRRARLRP